MVPEEVIVSKRQDKTRKKTRCNKSELCVYLHPKYIRHIKVDEARNNGRRPHWSMNKDVVTETISPRVTCPADN